MKWILQIVLICGMELYFNGCYGWRWFVPFSWEKSYREYKDMERLNQLPDNEEKYNKMLSYFGLSLDTIDWDEINKEVKKLDKENWRYEKGRAEYLVGISGYFYDGRIEARVRMYSKDAKFNKHNISFMYLACKWHTRRYYLVLEDYYGDYRLRWEEL